MFWVLGERHSVNSRYAVTDSILSIRSYFESSYYSISRTDRVRSWGGFFSWIIPLNASEEGLRCDQQFKDQRVCILEKYITVVYIII